jgi:hypothetical protein
MPRPAVAHRIARLLLASGGSLTMLAAVAAPGAEQAAADERGVDGSYCASTGGAPATMRAWANTNGNPKDWVPYGGRVHACTYTAPDTSQITLWERTLRSPVATMAALAYYAEVPPQGGGGGNPSLGYCVQLGGAWQIGNGLDGGGWATDRGERVYSMCMFADGSAIDAWGLFYHSAGIVRGIDLGTVLKFADPY